MHESLCVYVCDHVHVSVSFWEGDAQVHLTSRLSALRAYVQNDLCVRRQNVRVFQPRGCFDGTRGCVLDVHTVAFSRHVPWFFQRTHAHCHHTQPHTHTPHATHNARNTLSQTTDIQHGNTLPTNTPSTTAHNIKYNGSECLDTPTSFCTPVIHRWI